MAALVVLASTLIAIPEAYAQTASVHRKTKAAQAKRAELTGDSKQTTFRLGLSNGVRAEIFTLADPYRVVVDLPEVAFHLPEGSGEKGGGLISAFRYGLVSEGKARIVMDANGPVVIKHAAMNPKDGQAVELIIELVPTSAHAFGAGTGAGAQPQPPPAPPVPQRDVAKGAPPAPTASPGREIERAPKVTRAKPLVVIDAGHGGIDPGTTSAGNVKEKTVVLAVALALRSQLAASGRYDVRMTRKTDVFVPLDRRVQMSRELDADLFISLHADAIAQKGLAKNVRGATVYTLSEDASDEEARRMAEKENNSDAVAGLQTSAFEGEGDVRNILIDLLKRETSNFSADFSNILVKRMGQSISLSSRPQRSAAFKVLRQADTPSVLVELGYMSNPKDEELLQSAAWQRRVAASIGSAVDAYFSRRTATAR
ncbi:N-acetylmuramoyl-L-alanine amidase [Hyphomicrobium sp. D-2]|uniref:N-acetylmuramoyl-L-alanine amidase n=1 Tax=Hyphomicrobium sp. D-2 TaxID=3041621 RepID=UPI0024582320|nr:N-acetylmuramoyl-L-alanine amidase [Hyphomicrobium sp. D-2]MDH4983903.1 N-acetylmuramoyl-L-alanine amidase [Hyphomicrobium sp. D-2]